MFEEDYFDPKRHQWLVLRGGEALFVSAEEIECQWEFRCYDWEYENWSPKASGVLIALPGREGAHELLAMCAGTKDYTAVPLDSVHGACLLFNEMNPADACKAWLELGKAAFGTAVDGRRGGGNDKDNHGKRG